MPEASIIYGQTDAIENEKMVLIAKIVRVVLISQ